MTKVFIHKRAQARNLGGLFELVKEYDSDYLHRAGRSWREWGAARQAIEDGDLVNGDVALITYSDPTICPRLVKITRDNVAAVPYPIEIPCRCEPQE